MNFEQTVEFLTKIVSIESQSKNIKGVNLVQNEIEAQLQLLGFTTRRIPHPENLFGDLLVGERMRSDLIATWTNFIGHADTVLPSTLMRKEGLKLIGAGVADDKGGVATMLMTISKISKEDQLNNFRVVISPNEEIGSLGFHEYFKIFGKDSSLNLGFEPGLEEGEYISSRNGNRWYEIHFKSSSGHAGRAPKGRINLNHRLAHLIVNLEKKLEIFPDIKFHVTNIQNTTDKFNVIPEELKIRLDARFLNFDDLDLLHESLIQEIQIMSRPCDQIGIQVTSSFEIADDCPPMAKMNSELYSDLGENHRHSGGAADINYFSTKNALNLDGCGGRGGMLHSREEWFDLESMQKRSDFLSRFLQKKTEIRYKPDSVLNYHSSRP